jgi:hypothetical protein
MIDFRKHEQVQAQMGYVGDATKIGDGGVRIR